MLYSLHDTEKYRFRSLGCCIGYNAVFFKTRLEVHELFSDLWLIDKFRQQNMFLFQHLDAFIIAVDFFNRPDNEI
jgi:hypothetical protein